MSYAHHYSQPYPYIRDSAQYASAPYPSTTSPAYAAPPRSDAASLSHHYTHDPARHRTSSLHAHPHSPLYPSSSSNPQMLNAQQPPRAHPYDAPAHPAPATYLPAQQHDLHHSHSQQQQQHHSQQQDYLRAGTGTPEYYYAHPAHEHPSPPRPFPCDLCALSFNRAHDLKRHRDTHSGERPFLCNGGCGKTFTRKDALKRHQLVKSCGRADE